MADEDTTKLDSNEEDEATDDDQQVDGVTQDESEDDDTGSDADSENEETGEDDESDEDSDSGKGDGTFTKRFTQVKGDTPEDYLKNLEDTYIKSSTESVRLNKKVKEMEAQVEAVKKLVAQNPDLADKLQQEGVASPARPSDVNPALAYAEAEMNRRWQEEYKEFAENHPEIESDPELADQLDETLKIVRDVVWNKEKRLMGMGEGLNKAWKLLDKEESPKEKVRSAVRDQASQSKTGGTTKSEGKPKFTDKQIDIHMEIANVDRKTAIKQLSEYIQ